MPKVPAREYRIDFLSYHATTVGLGALAINSEAVREHTSNLIKALRQEMDDAPKVENGAKPIRMTDKEVAAILAALTKALDVAPQSHFHQYIRQFALVEWATQAPRLYTNACDDLDISPTKHVPELQPDQ